MVPLSQQSELLRGAIDLLVQWPRFAQLFRDAGHFTSRLVLPIRLGRARILRMPDGHRIFYTWSRPPKPVLTLPSKAEHWQDDGPFLWIGDVVWDRGTPPRAAVEQIERDLLAQGIAKPGEKVLFYRMHRHRYGSGTIRER